MGRRKERKDEDVCIPEHVAPVARPGEAAGADRGLAFRGSRPDEVKEREAGRELEIVVTVDDHVGVFPAVGPRRALLT